MSQETTKCDGPKDSRSTSPTTTSTAQTLRSTQQPHSWGLKTPPTRKVRSSSDIRDEESENDSLSVMTPSQPLHDKLERLEQQWSAGRTTSSERPASEHLASAAGSRPSHRPRAATMSSPPPTSPSSTQRTPARRKKLPVEIIGSPDEFPGRGDRQQSVFDRLYQQGKAQTASRRHRGPGRTYRSLPSPRTPQSSSIEGTISTLSSSESVFDRLYKNEKRHVSPRMSTSTRSLSSSREKYQSDAASAAASLERRLSYAPPHAKRRNRVVGKAVSSRYESRKSVPTTPPRSESSSYSPRYKSLDTESVASASTDSVFERLYKGEKRPAPVLPEEKSHTRRLTRRPRPKTMSSESPPTKHSSSNSVFERLYRGEKRPTSDLIMGSTRQLGKGRNDNVADTSFSARDEAAHAEVSILQDALLAAQDADESFLHDDLPIPTILYSSDDLQMGNRDAADVLARLKLHVFVRRIQRCARAYISRRGQVRSCTCPSSPDTRKYRAVRLIQRAWRGHHCRLMMLASLLQSWCYTCDFDDSVDYNRILSMKIRLQALKKAMPFAGDAVLTRIRVDERAITLNWSKQVVVHFRCSGVAEMETAVVTLTCQVRRLAFLQSWSNRKLSTLICTAALSRVLNRDTARLVEASVILIQSWVRAQLYKARGPHAYIIGRGRLAGIRTVGLNYAAQYLTPTSLQRRSAITLQSAWRCHRSQIQAADAFLKSWRVNSEINSAISENRILVMRLRLYSLAKAIGRVDCWWITEDVRVEDALVRVNWEREVGVHYTERGMSKLGSCIIRVTCEAENASFMKRWSRRKLAILIVKAALERALVRDRDGLVNASATLIQAWSRMNKQRIEYQRRLNACRTIQSFFREECSCSTLFSQAEVVAMDETSSSNLSLQDNKLSKTPSLPESEERAASTIQCCWRRFRAIRQMQTQDRASRVIQSVMRRRLALRKMQSRREAVELLQVAVRSFVQELYSDKRLRSTVAIQSFWRTALTRSAFGQLRTSAITIQSWERRRQCVNMFDALQKRGSRTLKATAASLIQSHFRGAGVRTRMALERKSALTIQSACRRHEAMHSFHSVRMGVIALQAAHRGIMARRLILLWHTLVARARLALLVQTLWRGRQIRRQYVELCTSAIIIQTMYRMHHALCSLRLALKGIITLQNLHRRRSRRHRNRLQIVAAVKLQKWYRCWELRTDFLTLRKAAVEIQAFERRQRCLSRYGRFVRSLVRLQAIARGARTRMLMASTRRSAELIQAQWRMCRCKENFLVVRAAAVMIQSAYHGTATRRSLAVQSSAVIRIQAVWRGKRNRCLFSSARAYERKRKALAILTLQRFVQKWLCRRLAATILIQSWFRKHSTREEFLALRQFSILIQTAERRRRCIAKYTSVALGVIRLQAQFRGLTIRQKEAKEAAAVTIQRCFRVFLFRQHYAHLRRITILIQAAERRRQCLAKYSLISHNIRRLQARCRTFLTRKMLLRRAAKEEAALVVQRHFRGCCLRHDYLSLKSGCVTIQSLQRRRRCMGEYVLAQCGVRHLQALCRGFLTRRMLVRHDEAEAAVLVVQQLYRGYRLRQRYLALKRSSIVVQKVERRRRCMEEYVLAQRGVRHFQALYRGVSTRRRLVRREETEAAALVLQRHCRGCYHRQKYLMLRRSALVIQAAERRRQCVDEYVIIQRGLRQLQARCRGVTTRTMMSRLEESETAALIVQRCFRGYNRRQSYLLLKRSCVVVQTAERRRQCKEEYAILQRGVRNLQARYRGLSTRKMLLRLEESEAAALVVQRYYRGFYSRHRHLMLGGGAIVIQAAERRRQCTKELALVQRGVRHLQARCRGVSTRKMMSRLDESEAAAIIAQRCFRGHYLRQRYLLLKRCAIVIQAAERRRQCTEELIIVQRGVSHLQASYRAVSTRKMLFRRQECEAAALVVQRHFRGYHRRQRNSMLKRVAIVIQAAERRRHCTKEWIIIQSGVHRLQARYRGVSTRKMLLRLEECEAAALTVQQYFRGSYLRKRYLMLKRDAIVIQAAARRRRCVVEYALVLMSARHIQAGFRGFFARSMLARQAETKDKAAITIQRRCRGLMSRRDWLMQRHSIIRIQTMERRRRSFEIYKLCIHNVCILQAVSRGASTRRLLMVRSRAARLIQASWRASLVRNNYKAVRTSVILIQSTFRARIVFRTILKVRLGVTAVQSMHRGLLARRKYAALRSNLSPVDSSAAAIQSLLRLFLVKRRMSIMHASARLIQVAYVSWKMQITLLMVQSSVVLLQRSVRGQLQRSAARFALSHINASLRSITLGSFFRITTDMDSGVLLMKRAWSVAAELAREGACIVIQSAARRLIYSRYTDGLRDRRGLPALKLFVNRNAATAFSSLKSVTTRVSSGAKLDRRATNELPRLQKSGRSDSVESTTDECRERQDSAQIIQRAFRSHSFERSMHIRDAAACQLQKMYRQRLATSQYNACRAGMLSMQRRFRASRVISERAQKESSATRIQGWWRAHRQSEQYRHMRSAIVSVQARQRTRAALRTLAARIHAANVIQRSYRAWQRRELARSVVIAKMLAVVRVQGIWRMHYKRTQYGAIRTAVVILQSQHRMLISSRSFGIQKGAALAIQRFYRAWHQRALFRSAMMVKVSAAIRLQRMWRLHRQRSQYRAVHALTVSLQAFYRMRVASLSLKVQRRAAVAIQMFYRTQQQVALVRSDLRETELAVICLQGIWRMRRDQVRYIAIRSAAISVQAYYRMVVTSRSFCVQRKSAVLIQAACRSWCLREMYLRVRQSITKLQAAVRHFLACKALRNAHDAAIAIQRLWRGSLQRCRNATDESRKMDANGTSKKIAAIRKSTVDETMVSTPRRHGAVVLRNTSGEAFNKIDRARLCTQLESSIKLQVDLDSERVVDCLVLDRETRALPASAGICIGRLAHRFCESLAKNTTVETVAVGRDDSRFTEVAVIDDTVNDDFGEVVSSASCRDAVASVQEAKLLAYEDGPKKDASEEEFDTPANGTTDSFGEGTFLAPEMGTAALALPPTKTGRAQNEQSPSTNTIQLAMEAQQLLCEARRARSDFLKARVTPAMSSKRGSGELQSSSRRRHTLVADSKSMDGELFGKTSSEEELPSPIKRQADHDWDWTKDWTWTS